MSSNPPVSTPSLAKGAALTPDTWADFVARLRHDCVGEGVADHCTANAIFTVEARRIVAGLDMDYTDQRLIYCDETEWANPQAYWDDHDERGHTKLNEAAQNAHELDFLALDGEDQWGLLGDLPDHTVTGWKEEWEHVNSHFTKDAAEAFIKRKGHDYPKGMRVYVESQYYAWEFNAIKGAILSGRLTLTA